MWGTLCGGLCYVKVDQVTMYYIGPRNIFGSQQPLTQCWHLLMLRVVLFYC